MKRNIFLHFMATLLLLLLSVNNIHAQWRNLFNGKDLKGWNQKNGAAKYYVENGEIVGVTVSNTTNSFLCTEEEFSEFIFEVELKVDEVMNSGIQFRSLSKADYQNYRVHG